MKELKQEDFSYFVFEWLVQFPEIKHFVSNRKHGFSTEKHESLNLGLHVKDAQENVKENRNKLAKRLAIKPKNFRLVKQIHGNKVLLAEEVPSGWEISLEELPEADALITQNKNLCLTILTADCVPVMMFDPITQSIGIAHAGWRGTTQKIGLKMLRMMQKQFGTNPKDVWVGLGPAISSEFYEVGEEVEDAVALAFDSTDGYILQNPKKPGKKYFDLWQGNIRPLVSYGIPERQIECAYLCSFKEKELFFSARRDGLKSGRFASGIFLV